MAQTNMIHFARGDEIESKKKYNDVSLKLKNLVERYSSDTKMAFLRGIAYKLHAF